MKRVFVSVVVAAAVAALGIMPAATAATSSTATTGAGIKVNPLSQHASHCAQYYRYVNCLVSLKNTKAARVFWWMENQTASSDNTLDYSLLLANGEAGDYVDGYLNPGQSVTVEISTEDCSRGYGQYWTWIVGGSLGSTTFAPQATILNCS